jgi:hypothetical protein
MEVPVTWFIHTGRSERSYAELLHNLKHFITENQMSPNAIFLDFEATLNAALEQKFPGVSVMPPGGHQLETWRNKTKCLYSQKCLTISLLLMYLAKEWEQYEAQLEAPHLRPKKRQAISSTEEPNVPMEDPKHPKPSASILNPQKLHTYTSGVRFNERVLWPHYASKLDLTGDDTLYT